MNPSTFQHAGEYEHRNTTDPAVIRWILKLRERESYWAVECVACDVIWQVPFYAAENSE